MIFSKKQAGRTKEQYERDVGLLYGRDVTTLLIAQAHSYFAHSAREDDHPWREGTVELTGVLSSRGGLADGDLAIRVRLKFLDFSKMDGSIGSCSLTHLLTDEKLPVEQRRLLCEVTINDPENRLARRAFAAVRDAAISRRPFERFRMHIEKVDLQAALAELKKKGVGPYLKVQGFGMWPTVTLPDAPQWAWLDEGDLPY
ncbi:hypothetical protein [Microvirga vignae]|nr:hypothetical protein [Microvirga vignae]